MDSSSARKARGSSLFAKAVLEIALKRVCKIHRRQPGAAVEKEQDRIGCAGLVGLFWTRLGTENGASGVELVATIIATASYCAGSVVAHP